LFAGLFEDLLDCVFCFVGVEEGLTLVTTEGDEVELFGLLEAFEAGGHGGTSSLHPTLRKMREGWGTRGFWVGGESKGGHPAPAVLVGFYVWATRPRYFALGPRVISFRVVSLSEDNSIRFPLSEPSTVSARMRPESPVQMVISPTRNLFA
jgi:hypothetical protein